jgi:hypothetical protein
MRKTVYLVLTFSLAASAASAGQKIVGARETTVDEPFCAG